MSATSYTSPTTLRLLQEEASLGHEINPDFLVVPETIGFFSAFETVASYAFRSGMNARIRELQAGHQNSYDALLAAGFAPAPGYGDVATEEIPRWRIERYLRDHDRDIITERNLGNDDPLLKTIAELEEAHKLVVQDYTNRFTAAQRSFSTSGKIGGVIGGLVAAPVVDPLEGLLTAGSFFLPSVRALPFVSRILAGSGIGAGITATSEALRFEGNVDFVQRYLNPDYTRLDALKDAGLNVAASFGGNVVLSGTAAGIARLFRNFRPGNLTQKQKDAMNMARDVMEIIEESPPGVGPGGRDLTPEEHIATYNKTVSDFESGAMLDLSEHFPEGETGEITPRYPPPPEFTETMSRERAAADIVTPEIESLSAEARNTINEGFGGTDPATAVQRTRTMSANLEMLLACIARLSGQP